MRIIGCDSFPPNSTLIKKRRSVDISACFATFPANIAQFGKKEREYFTHVCFMGFVNRKCYKHFLSCKIIPDKNNDNNNKKNLIDFSKRLKDVSFSMSDSVRH